MGVNPPRTFEEVIIPYLQHARQHSATATKRPCTA
uniref:Uncharacterized protein n=1 Tax=Pseudomonas phage PACT201 TaxID=3230130 RepID=A0AAU8GVZ4_9VIRU